MIDFLEKSLKKRRKVVVKEEEEGKEQRKDGDDYINLSLINIMTSLTAQMGNLNLGNPDRRGTGENMNTGHGSRLTNTVTQARNVARAASRLGRNTSGVGKKLNFGLSGTRDSPGGRRRRRRRRSSKRRKPRKSKKKRRRRRKKRTKKKRRRRR